ncbi:MAG: hypothetical protein QOG04_1006 [Actinomycetota bacterium]|jgi:hypothetical protein|nr:hypothetical protein [Actinomycetota bacterium]
MSPIVKKALAAVALKEVYDRVQESRQPQKASFLGRLFKLTLIGGILGGAAYAYKNGLLPIGQGKGGSNSYDSYDSSMTVQRPLETSTNNDPVGAPNV